MQLIDVVKPEPKTALELFENWKNSQISRYISGSTFSKKIEIRQIEKLDPAVCPPDSRGRVICERNGEHSWFSHAMDKAY